jgi:hypothetical protein
MATDFQSPPGFSLTSLMSDIIDDAQELIRQQMALFRQDLRNDVRKMSEASVCLAAGIAVTVIAGFLLLLMLPLLLNWLVPTIPLWGCFGIIGGLTAVVGGGLLYAGVRQIQAVHPLSDPSAEALKENLQWMTPRK